MRTEREIFEAIEEVIQAYGSRHVEKILSHSVLQESELRELRGAAQATNDLAKQLRKTLGYTPEEF
jgi:hypothetical protein